MAGGRMGNRPAQTAACKMGTCGASCNMGFGDCDGNLGNGCEADVSADANNCGACGHVCQGSNSTQKCINGACVITGCNQNFADCDKKPDNGCESLLPFDPMNCAGCGKVCMAPPHAMPTCSNGMCGVGACMMGWADCDMVAMNGCEADLTSIQSCGMCNNVCAAPANASAGCTMPMCGVGLCNMGFGDCDKKANNGCEAVLATDVSNCGMCGTVCNFANAQSSCAGGICQMGACVMGYADCNMMALDGCEVSTATDPNNCGQCNMACPMNTPFCIAGVCSIDDCPWPWFYYYTVDQ